MGFTNEGLGFNVPISFLIGAYKWGLRVYTNQFLTLPTLNVKDVFENVLLAGEMLKIEKPTFNFPQWERFLGGLCASGWGNVKKCFENVLLAGEMLKSEKPTFNISLAGEILKKLKMLKMGWTMFVYREEC